MRRLSVFLVPLIVAACGGEGGENSMRCGITHTVAANRVLEHLQSGSRLLTEPPPDALGTVPARVIGHGTRAALAAETDQGLLIGYEGEGFPAAGFGVVLLEDSADAFQGVLIYDIEPPSGYPQLGTVASGNRSLPLFGMRVSWAAVSDEECPLFAPLDTADAG
ncbi:MAG: hypothetical protein PVF27_04425 [Gemmatimonadales bacterium]|jgi:hypothetical protein